METQPERDSSKSSSMTCTKVVQKTKTNIKKHFLLDLRSEQALRRSPYSCFCVKARNHRPQCQHKQPQGQHGPIEKTHNLKTPAEEMNSEIEVKLLTHLNTRMQNSAKTQTQTTEFTMSSTQLIEFLLVIQFQT